MPVFLQMKYNTIPLRHRGARECVCVHELEIRYPAKENTAVEAVCALTSEIRYSSKTTMSLGFIVCERARLCVCVYTQSQHLSRCVYALAAKQPC